MMKRGSSFFSPAEGGSSGGKSSGIKCNIVLLDGREVQLDINKKTPGHWIFDHASRKLGISEREHFGLLYEDDQKCQQWLEMTKSIKKQVKKNHSRVFYCVRLYPTDPLSINDSTRVQLYWQLKRDFTSGRLPCLLDTSLQLVALMAQVEIGDWIGDSIDYNDQLNLQKKEVDLQTNEITKRHQHLGGISESEARGQFLKLVSLLDFYGMVFYDVKYEDKVHYMLGMSPFGLALCKKMKIAQSYNWSRVVQVLYRGRRFIVRVSGDWIADNQVQQLNFDVDSSKTCKDLYNTFVEHIHFYTKQKKEKKQDNKSDMPTAVFSNLPMSSSIEDLSRELMGKKTKDDRLHRSLSLPRRTKNKLDMQSLFSHPPSTNTFGNDPVLQTLQSRRTKNRSQSVSPSNQSDTTIHSEGSGETGMGMESACTTGMNRFDTQSIISSNPIHDSLLDLANDLGIDDQQSDVFVIQDFESSPGQKHRCNSLPHIAVLDSTGVANNNDDSPVTHQRSNTRIQSTSDEKLQSRRKLILSWVKEQKKRDQAKLSSITTNSTDNMTNLSPHMTPPTLHSLSNFGGSSPLRTYKLKTKSSSPPIERPSSSMLPSVYSHGYDLYDVPRPSPVPSPCLRLRQRPQSSSARSSLHSIQGVESDYDIPRSMNDLCRVDSPHLTRLPLSTEHVRSVNSHYTSSSSDHTSQLTMLKDEYPDYDFPRSISIENDDPDYDVPRSVRSLCTADTKSEGNISFGALDKMIAEIDSEIAGTIGNEGIEQESVTDAKTVLEPDSVDDRSVETENEPVEVKNKTTKVENILVEQHEIKNAQESNSDKIVPSDNNTVAKQNTIDETILANRVLRPLLHQPSSFPQITSTLIQESTYDRLSARQALEQLKKDGIVSQDAQEVKKHSVDDLKENVRSTNYTNNPPAELASQSKLEELLQNGSINSNGSLKRLPFDPNFFARQTSLEQTHSIQQQQQQKQQQWKPQYIPQGDTTQSRQQSSTTTDHTDQPIIEPIYQEISELARGNHRTQRSWSGGNKTNFSTVASTQKGADCHKRTYSGGDLLSVKQHSSEAVNDNDLVKNTSSLDRFGSQSSSMRYPLKLSIPPQSVNDNESIPNSPTFYTKNPDAATMPELQPLHTQSQPLHTQSQHFFKDHLTNLDSNIPRGHNRVMKWMQQSAFWDPNTNQAGVTGPVQVGVTSIPPSVPPNPPGVPMGQIGRPIPLSQSIHSQISQGGAQRLHNNNQFKDHLYEDPNHLKLVSNMMRSSSMSHQRMRHTTTTSTSSTSTLPYVTRELPSSKSGSTMYATDV